MEAIAAEASVGVNVLGGEVGVTGGVNVGIGAHAEIGYRDSAVDGWNSFFLLNYPLKMVHRSTNLDKKRIKNTRNSY